MKASLHVVWQAARCICVCTVLSLALFYSERLVQSGNVIPTLEFYHQKRLWTVKPRFYIVEMFLVPT